MHSGGGTKEEPYSDIFIEAPEKEAKIIFYNRFGHNPERVSCTCCGEDYSISESISLKQATGFHRGCPSLETPKDPETNRYLNNDPIMKAHRYLDPDDEIPKGYRKSKIDSNWKEWQSLENYIQGATVLVIYKKDLKPEERTGEVPEQGFVWKD